MSGKIINFFKKRIIIIAAVLFVTGISLLAGMFGRFDILITVDACALALFIMYVLNNRAKASLSEENKKLKAERDKLKNSTINMQKVRKIFELNLYETESAAYRIMDEEIEGEKGKKVRFSGALHMKIKAKYGIDLKLVKFVVNKQERVVYIKGAMPRLMGYDLDTSWEIDNIAEQEKKFIFVKTGEWKTNPKLEKTLSKRKEEFVSSQRSEIDSRGIPEFEFLLPLLKKDVEEMLKNIFSGLDYEIKIGENVGGVLIECEEFINNTQKYLNS